MSDLVTRLREMAAISRSAWSDTTGLDHDELEVRVCRLAEADAMAGAADEIERLTAENRQVLGQADTWAMQRASYVEDIRSGDRALAEAQAETASLTAERNVSPMFVGEDSAFADAGVQGHVQVRVGQKKLMARVRMTYEAMKDSMSSEGAFKSARRDEMDSLIKDIARREEYALADWQQAEANCAAFADEWDEARALLERCVRQVRGNRGAWQAASSASAAALVARDKAIAECDALLADIERVLGKEAT